jgi:spore germination protein GerM
MSRNLKWAIGILSVAVLIGLLSLRSLHEHVTRLAQSQATEEQARREVVAPKISTPSDVTVNAQFFWISSTAADRLEAVTVPLPLSADPVLRSEQLLRELIASPPSEEQRTLPADLTLLGFYALPDGTAIADFSNELASETPSGILSESLAVDSIVETLAANVPRLTRLKILIHGQQEDTLAGHVDLTGFFDLHAPAAQAAEVGTSRPGNPAAVQTRN